MAKTHPKTSNEVRLQGNEEYKAGNFETAITMYLLALVIDPADHTPLGNLTAVRYESGDYHGALRDIDKALQKEKIPSKILQLSLRRLRCYFYQGKLEEAMNEADRLLDVDSAAQHGVEIVKLKEAAKRMVDDGWKGRQKAPIEGGLYRAQIWKDCHEFFPRGHDDAEPLVSKSQLQLLGQNAPLDLALFYGGFGDGRNFFQQIHHIMAYDRARMRMEKTMGSSSKVPEKNKYFFTMVDHHPYVLGRVLVMWRLLYDVGTLPQQIKDLKERTREKYKLLSTMWYIFAADIMPKFAYDRLIATITKLRDGKDFGISWINVEEHTAAVIRKVYDTWLGPAKDLYSVDYAQKAFDALISRENDLYMDTLWPFVKIEWELKQYKKTLVMIPPRDLLRLEEHELREILLAETSEDAKVKNVREHAKKNWKVNMTMYDPAGHKTPWMKPWTDSTHILGNMASYVRCISEEGMRDALFYRKQRKLETLGSVETMVVYFKSIAEWLARNTEILTVDLRLGDVYSTMDNIRYSDNPRLYDAIHLSNIPDYTGGHLTTTLHSQALLKPHAFIQFNCLSNTGLWSNLDHAMSEYFGLPNLGAVTRYMGLSLAPGEEYDPSHGFLSMLPDYRWTITPAGPVLGKSELQYWLTHMFFKLALPTKRPPEQPAYTTGGFSRVNEPLTLTTFLRLCCYMIDVQHYPPHWIATLLDSLLTGAIVTTAHPSSVCPLPVQQLMARHPVTKFATIPFLSELRALLVRNQHRLPFQLTAPLPKTKDIVRLEIALTPIADTAIHPVLTLVFAKALRQQDMIPPPRSVPKDRTLWDVLADADNARKRQTVVVGGVEWEGKWNRTGATGTTEKMRAWCWVEKAAVERWKREGWEVGMVRTDLWCLVTMVEPVATVKIVKTLW